MKVLDRHHYALALLFLRILLGIILIMQGYGKVFQYGVPEVYDMFFKSYAESTFLSEGILKLTAYFTSYVEFIGGLLIILGFFRMVSYLAVAIVLIVVSFGHGLVQPIWDLQHVFFRAVMVFTLLIIPASKDAFSADQIINQIRLKK